MAQIATGVEIKIPQNFKFNKDFDVSNISLDYLQFNEVKSLIQRCSRSCLHCENGKCIVCPKGFYSFKEECYKSCPLDTKANNLNFKCENDSTVYTKAYTISRCRNSCGKTFKDCR